MACPSRRYQGLRCARSRDRLRLLSRSGIVVLQWSGVVVAVCRSGPLSGRREWFSGLWQGHRVSNTGSSAWHSLHSSAISIIAADPVGGGPARTALMFLRPLAGNNHQNLSKPPCSCDVKAAPCSDHCKGSGSYRRSRSLVPWRPCSRHVWRFGASHEQRGEETLRLRCLDRRCARDHW